MKDIQIRDLRGMTEFQAAVQLQRAVWGEDDMPDPADLMMVLQAEGGLVAGAFVEGRLVGFVFGFPTSDPAIQHSHRLAVLPEMRGLKLGSLLKWHQRDWCLARGIRHVRWTFDPMRPLNASLNINHLGGRASTYLVDYYGEMAGINSGLPSDRLMVDWHLDAPDVAARARGDVPDGDGHCVLTVPVPMRGDEARPDAALAGRQRAVRESLLKAFADGCEITGFDRAANAYRLSRKG